MRASFHHQHHHQHDDEIGRASFHLFKKAGRHEKGAGRRALQKRPRQNTDTGITLPLSGGKSRFSSAFQLSSSNASFFCIFLIDHAMYLFVLFCCVLPVWNLNQRLRERRLSPGYGYPGLILIHQTRKGPMESFAIFFYPGVSYLGQIPVVHSGGDNKY